MSRGRQLGFWMCLALVMGNMIGSGVFLLPASLAPYGLNSLYGWLLTAAGSLLLAMVFAGLSRAFPGKPAYSYVQMAFGDRTGFVVAWGYWVAVWVGNAAVAIAAVSYLSYVLPWISTTPGASIGVTLGFIWLFTIINMLGARESGSVQVLTTVLKLLPLLAVIVLGLILLGQGRMIDANAGAPAVAFSWDAVDASAVLTLWAFLGLESAAVASEKIRDPERIIPRATFWGTLITALVYILICTVVIVLIPAKELAVSSAPLADLIARYWGADWGDWIAAFAAISALGALNGWILLQGELPGQMARAGAFPAWLARRSQRDTPVPALLLTGVLVSVVVLLNAEKGMVEIFTFLLLISTSAILVMYLLSAAGALLLYKRGELSLPRPMTGFLTAAAGASVYALWALFGAGQDAVLWGFFLLASALPVYYFSRGQTRQALLSLPILAIVPIWHVITHFRM